MQDLVTPVKEHFTPRPQPPPKHQDAGIALQIDVREELGRYNNPDMLICELDDFLTSYGPRQNDLESEEDADRLFKKMVSGKLVDKDEGGKFRWTEYAEDTPITPGYQELVGFKPVQKIVDAVLKYIEHGQTKTNMKFIPVPNNSLTSDILGIYQKLKGCFVSAPHTEGGIQVREITVPIEFNKQRSARDRAIVHLQILGACHHIMSEDIRRMWIFGLTFEDDLCSVWYFSRSHSVKIVAFNCMMNPKAFIRVLLSFAKATPRDLGIDPTIHLGPKNADGTASYVFQVPLTDSTNSLFFKTVHTVSDPRPMAIAGRTTRVWKVVQVSSSSGEKIINPKEAILKDVWLNEGSKTETENLDAIFAAVDDFVDTGIAKMLKDDSTATRESLLSSPDAVKRTMNQIIEHDLQFKSFDEISKDRLCSNLANKAYRYLFLTKLHAWRGEVCKPLGENVWRSSKLFSSYSIKYLHDSNNCVRDITTVNTRQPTFENLTQPIVGDKEQNEEEGEQHSHRFVPKRQSRFIYEEVCTTLQNLDTLGEVVDILYKTMDAMHILYLAGWVHRDISSNNIMAYRSSPDKPWGVKLADFEFARLMVDSNREPSADPRTGTPYFMAVEIGSGVYLLQDYFLVMKNTNSTRKYHVVKPVTLADALEGETSSEPYFNKLQRFKRFPFEIKIPTAPKPCWDKVPEPSAVVTHNYQHDLESIWWILLWIVLCRIKSPKPSSEVDIYFDHDIEKYLHRKSLLTNGLGTIEKHFSEDTEEFWSLLDGLCMSMYKAYLERAVFGHLDISASYSSIENKFAEDLRAIRNSQGPWRNLPLIKSHAVKAKTIPPPAQAASVSNRKRNRDSDEYQDEDDEDEDKDARPTKTRKRTSKSSRG